MKKIIFMSGLILCINPNVCHAVVSLWERDKCIGYNVIDGVITVNSDCAWCDAAGATAPGDCTKGYANCTSYAYIAKQNEKFYDKNGQLVQQKDTDTVSTWRCGKNGWEEQIQNLPSGGGTNCDRYSYMDHDLGYCVLCPGPGIFYASSGQEVFPRGDNYKYELTGCNFSVSPGQILYDKTGTFETTQTVQCYHDGIL